jgi:hypothetical protein
VKETFKSTNFRADRLTMVDHCNEIINRYQAQRLRLTLRQLYYQLVTRNIITNQEKSYKNLGNLVSEARLSGLVDWDSIEDRVRVPRKPNEFANLKELVDAALYSYRLPRWKDQNHYVELWVEKDAISGVLSPMASQYHITLMVNRGYSSQSAMYESAKRFMSHTDEYTYSILLYLGDHDPSGEDMVRDIQDRLDMFGANVSVHKIALTMEQVEQYNPPPNPTKLTDTRSPAYIEKHGNQSWEVDALPPDVMHQIVEDSILEYVDMDLMNAVKVQEELDKKRLLGFVSSIKD